MTSKIENGIDQDLEELNLSDEEGNVEDPDKLTQWKYG